MGRNFKQGMGNGNFLGLFNKCTTTVARMPKSYPKCISGAAPGSYSDKGRAREHEALALFVWVICFCSPQTAQLSSLLPPILETAHFFSPPQYNKAES